MTHNYCTLNMLETPIGNLDLQIRRLDCSKGHGLLPAKAVDATLDVNFLSFYSWQSFNIQSEPTSFMTIHDQSNNATKMLRNA